MTLCESMQTRIPRAISVDPRVRSVLFATIDSKISNYSAKHDRSASDGYDGEVDIDPRQAVRDLATPSAMKR